MRWSRWARCFVFSALGACRDPAPVAGESTRLRAGERAPAVTSAWDGGVVRLRGVRGETLGLQVLSSPSSSSPPSSGARLELPAEVARVAAFAVRSLDVSEPSTALYGASRGRGRYPDLLDAPGPAAAPAYFDVAIARDARPGRYAGRLVIDSRTFAVEVRVEPFTIDVTRAPRVWVFYLPAELARARGGPDDDGAAELADERAYAELFAAHGCLFASDLPPARARLRSPRGATPWPGA